MNSCISKKINRLRQGLPPRTLDLFAGAGGLSLGFHKSGYTIVGAVEVNDCAAETHRLNFSGKSEHYMIHKDITQITPDKLINHCIGKDELLTEVVDVIIGGPPCQPFSSVGRAKLREVAGHPEAYLHDNRVTLYTRYMAMVDAFKPLAFVMENVKGIGRFKGRNIAEEICIQAEELGYQVRYALLNSAWYGVPQMRERMIIIGIHRDLGLEPSFPLRTHDLNLPKGYFTSRLLSDKEFYGEHYVNSIPAIVSPNDAVTAKIALEDLPPITEHLIKPQKKGPRKFDTLLRYVSPPNSEFVKQMRGWEGFESVEGVYDHIIRFTPRDYPIFKQMEPDDEYPKAYEIALKLFEAKLKKMEKELGRKLEPGEELYSSLKKEIVPPYDPSKYPNKWRKINGDFPARTLMAHLSKDTYSHIHFDSKQARSISVREAARLQSFPDGFFFHGCMGDKYRQIGNAVPPLMASAIAENLLMKISCSLSISDSLAI